MYISTYTKSKIGENVCLIIALPLPLVSRSLLHNPLIWISLLPRLITRFRRRSPDRYRMHIALTFTTSTTVGMICSIHCHTSDCRSDIQPSTAPGLTQLSELMVWIARHSDGCTSIFRHSTHFSTLQAYNNILQPLFIFRPSFISRNYSRIRARAATEDCRSSSSGTDTVYLRSQRDHMQGQAIAAKCCLGGEHTWVHYTAHTAQEAAWDAGQKGLNGVARSHAIRSDDVALLLRLDMLDESKVCRTVWIILDAFHHVDTWSVTHKVHRPDSSSRTASTMPYRDAPSIVPPPLGLSDFGEGELPIRSAFPKVIIDGPLQMADTRRPWLVSLHLEASSFPYGCCSRYWHRIC